MDEMFVMNVPMTWSCWPPLAKTYSMRWGGSQLSVKRLERDSAPPSPRPWFLTGKGWLVLFRLEGSPCLKWRS
ncbi:hypothetical protein CHARACLAT_018247 [Characodon lateralis]|uniref:Uncharacterized protein n=1 Tax=Characodon lateralis TaxID=208331 RepID=A0ABU7EUN5_9TELE|nr:hypothetical protein [Characodon lateralis]